MNLHSDIKWRPRIGQKAEDFFNHPNYRNYVENAIAFNRKLNDERKKRLPYIDNQTGVAQRHYNNERHRRERMPGMKFGQIYSYPQRRWRKRKYQHLHEFDEPEIEETITSGENLSQNLETEPGQIPVETPVMTNGTESHASNDSNEDESKNLPIIGSNLPNIESNLPNIGSKPIIGSTSSTTTQNILSATSQKMNGHDIGITNGHGTTPKSNGIPSKRNGISKEWVYYDDDDAFLDYDPEVNSDADSDYGGSSRKKKSKGGKGRGGRGGRRGKK